MSELCKITGCNQPIHSHARAHRLCADHLRAYWKTHQRKNRRWAVGNSFIEEWDDNPLTSARNLVEREHGVLYPAWHENPVRVWERDLRALYDGDRYFLDNIIVVRVSVCCYDLFDYAGRRLRHITSTSNQRAMASLMDALKELEGVTA